MRLKEYIKTNNYNYKTFAQALGIKPRSDDAKKIFEFTDGQVTGQDLYEEQIQRKETNIQREKI